MKICQLYTGAFRPVIDRVEGGPTMEWTGPAGEPQVPCLYAHTERDAMLVHLVATHLMTVEQARRLYP